MELTPQLNHQLTCLINEAINSIDNKEQEGLITDFHITTNADNGEVTIMDDNDTVLAKTIVEGYEETDSEDFCNQIGKIMKKVLEKMNATNAFETLNLYKPFSFVLIDAAHETIEDLLVVDDESVMISDELLKGLDKELDDFIKNLLN